MPSTARGSPPILASMAKAHRIRKAANAVIAPSNTSMRRGRGAERESTTSPSAINGYDKDARIAGTIPFSARLSRKAEVAAKATAATTIQTAATISSQPANGSGRRLNTCRVKTDAPATPTT